MNIAVYKITTGEISRFVQCGYVMASIQCQDGEEFYLNCPPDATHIINNEPVTIIPDPVPPTEAEIKAGLVSAVQAELDSVAKSRNYDGILSLCSYATSTDTIFAAEGQAGVEWRDACWRYCYQVLANVKSGTRAIPDASAIVSELPSMQWPTG